jgi:hypothetical protein
METAYIYYVICSSVVFALVTIFIPVVYIFIKDTFVALRDRITIGAKIIRMLMAVGMIALILWGYYISYSLL